MPALAAVAALTCAAAALIANAPLAAQAAAAASTRPTATRVTPVSLATGKAGRPILIGIYSYPAGIEMPTSGVTAVVVSPYAGQVTLLNTTTLKAIATVNVWSYPVAAAITP